MSCTVQGQVRKFPSENEFCTVNKVVYVSSIHSFASNKVQFIVEWNSVYLWCNCQYLKSKTIIFNHIHLASDFQTVLRCFSKVGDCIGSLIEQCMRPWKSGWLHNFSSETFRLGTCFWLSRSITDINIWHQILNLT